MFPMKPNLDFVTQATKASPPTRSWPSTVPAFAVRPRTAWQRLQHSLKARNLSGGFLLRAIRRIPANCFRALDQR